MWLNEEKYVPSMAGLQGGQGQVFIVVRRILTLARIHFADALPLV
jgi:hypothetical protein